MFFIPLRFENVSEKLCRTRNAFAKDCLDIMKHYPVRCIVCFAGIACMALGIALTTKANFGTTPITSLPYVASLGFAPSLGFFTIVLNLLLVAVQVAIMRKRFPPMQYTQIPVSCLFGLLIDAWMFVLPDFSVPSFWLKLAVLASGVVALAIGVSMEVAADVVVLAADGAVKAISIVSRKDFGMAKTVFDVSMVLLGVVLSLALFQEIRGIGFGTAISAVFVGVIVKQLLGRWHGVVGK